MTDRLPLDWQERQKALDITLSCIVQAPAGSGKTELLVQRILSLLAVADKPEEVLSITFTRKAAGEMRLRLLKALERALDDTPPQEEHAVETWQRGRSVIARDKEKGWGLLHNPSRLQLMTIDGFCAFLTRRMPWLSRFGDQPGVTEHPAELYVRAAENVLERLETNRDGSGAIEQLLVHLDNRLTLLRDLIVTMLGRRDQWLRHLLAKRDDKARKILESGLQQFVAAYLAHTCELFGEDRYGELWELAQNASINLAETTPDHPLSTLKNKEKSPESLEQWQLLAGLMLTAAGSVRKTVNKTSGFPAGQEKDAVDAKKRMHLLLDSIRADIALKSVVEGLPLLPRMTYTPAQWQTLEALIELLPLAVMELQNVFRQQGQVDFIEIAGAAHSALGSVMSPEELLLQLDSRIRHILVDEFQDTSFAQYELLRLLTAGWEKGDGRTLFLVGDPMQSIYRFREAEVGLYLRVCQRGLDDLPIEKVVLNTNFRSRKNLVEWVNSKFHSLFPQVEDELSGAVGFNNSIAFDQSETAETVSVHCYQDRQDTQEANRVVELVKQSKQANPDGTIAVLVRSRNHLEAIIPALKSAGLNFQAQDLDCLTDRPVVQDILSIVRALLHPADRVAWLAILRAPWCGLRLEDLLVLCGGKTRKTIWQLMVEPDTQTEMFEKISSDGRNRLDRIIPVLERAQKNRGRLSLRRLVEATWVSLGGPACVDASEMIDAWQVFDLLEEFKEDFVIEQLEERLRQLYAAPDPQAGCGLQLMTIHKAKGLEFDTVILPGLGRGVRANERMLLRWLEHPDYELLLAPIPPLANEERDPTYNAIGQILQNKDRHETLRLLYVAATRAKSSLHLLGHVKVSAKGELSPTSGSLLAEIWPNCREDFSASLSVPDSDVGPESSSQGLKRLPGDWCLPEMAHFPGTKIEDVMVASIGGHYPEKEFRSRRSEEGRIIGTLVHQWLERITSDGLSLWSKKCLLDQRPLFEKQLLKGGIPMHRLDACISSVERCLSNTMSSERGRWLLHSHSDAYCEYCLNGIVDNQLVRASIDRTFLDQDGVRWIIDYKTNQLPNGEDKNLFLQNEKRRYEPQLRVYISLMGQLHKEDQIRTALYFPMFDGWIESV